MRAASLLLVALCLVCLASVCLGSIPAASPPSPAAHSSPLPTGEGGLTANPASANGAAPEPEAIVQKAQAVAAAAVEPKYSKGTDFLGPFGGVPINPTAHLQRVLAEDKQYVAAILRAPIDLGDPTSCKHSDLVKDEQELRQIALRINHRRISLRQQQHWIDSAREGLAKVETEISQTTATARNLAEELDALTAQKEDITNHVRRAVLLKELDRTSSNLMRLKDSRMKEEVSLQKKHNKFAIRNHEHNQVLERLNSMRTKHGLALGKLADPKPYRFAQVGMEAAAEEGNTQEAEAETEVEAETEFETEGESEAEAETTQESEAEAETEVEAGEE